jgi:hypothetical protein
MFNGEKPRIYYANPWQEVILTNFFAEPTVLLVLITNRGAGYS